MIEWGPSVKLEYFDTAKFLYEMALREIDEGNVLEGYARMGAAFSSAFMAGSDRYIEFKFLPRSVLPRKILSVEHVIAHVSAKIIRLWGASDLITRPLFTFERFPVVGHLLADVAKTLPEEGVFECVIDLGDGDGGGDLRHKVDEDYPWLSFSSSYPGSVLIPDPYFYFNNGYEDHRTNVAERAKPWRERHNIVFWRGGSGGPRLRAPTPADPLDWNCQQRLQLCSAVRTSVHRSMLDIALSHVRTIGEPYLRDALTEEGFVQPEVPKSAFLDYRYQVDVDGWTNSWSLLDKLISGSTVLKVRSALGYRQWYYDKLKPWVHFIPLAADASDLDEVMFWMIAHPDECEAIADSAATFTEDIRLTPALAEAEMAVRKILIPLG